MNWVYRALASLLVVAVFVGIAALAESAPSKPSAGKHAPTAPISDDDSSLKGMKIN